MRAQVKNAAKQIIRLSSWGRVLLETASTQTPVRPSVQFARFSLGDGRIPYWPVHPSSTVQNWRRIVIGVETSPGLMAGCYIQGGGGIEIGDYTQIAPGVGIISSNHSVVDSRVSIAKPVRIGSYCWLAMNSIVLPGVTLGDFTVVAAGAVVTKSHPDGYVILAGNPAKPIRELDPSECVRFRSEHEYHGFIHASDFAAFRRANLLV